MRILRICAISGESSSPLREVPTIPVSSGAPPGARPHRPYDGSTTAPPAVAVRTGYPPRAPEGNRTGYALGPYGAVRLNEEHAEQFFMKFVARQLSGISEGDMANRDQVARTKSGVSPAPETADDPT